MINFGIIGTGWRAEFFLRIAQACPERFTVAGIAGRTPEKVAGVAAKFGVPALASAEELVKKGRPLFVVTSLAWDANPVLLTELAGMDMPALSETPPAKSVEEMAALCALTARGAKIQVAEQYFLQPHHAARLAFIRTGKMGQVSQAQVSAAHGYHGVSLIRKFLGIGYENAKITATVYKSPIVEGPGRGGPPAEEKMVEAEQMIAHLDFGDRLGIFDFTGRQYFAEIRDPRVLIRGERGEIFNDTAAYLKDFRTPIRVDFRRHETGQHGNLAGHYLQGIQAGEEWVYRNPVAPARLYDDEIAMATCLLRMAEYVRGGEPFYPLEEACQDRYLAMVMEEAARTGEAVRTETQGWGKKPIK